MKSSDGNIIRQFAFVIWGLVLLTYLWALRSSLNDTPFQRMVQGIFSCSGLVVFAVCTTVSAVTVTYVLWHGMPWWEDIDLVFVWGLFTYVLSACAWVPLTMGDLTIEGTRRGFPFVSFLTQRVPLVASLCGALTVSVKVWVACGVWVQIGLCVWCGVAIFDAFVWDILYARWLLRDRDLDEYL